MIKDTDVKTKYPFSKVVVWGHKLGHPMTSNTFSFIHNEWVRTFKHFGYEVLWLSDQDDVSNIDFSNCLFLTEGQVDDNIPIRSDCKYVLHNCLDLQEKYGSIIENCLNLQVYYSDVHNRDVEVVDKEQLAYYQKTPFMKEGAGCDNRTLYQPWAAGLLPHEFDATNNAAKKYKRTKKIFWVGSIFGGPERNDDKMNELAKAAKVDGVSFVHAKINNEMAPRAIAESWIAPALQSSFQVNIGYVPCRVFKNIAPALQSSFQVNIGYVPCRVFKNISYGRMAPTNSKVVHDLFEGKLIYSADTEEMYKLAAAWEENPDQAVLDWLIERVRTKHTYINRVKNILEVL